MATKMLFYRQGTLVKPPQNRPETTIELNFDLDTATVNQEVSITDWVFTHGNNALSRKWIEDGMGTGFGIFEGEEFKIVVQRGAVTEEVFKGYLDYTQSKNFSDNLTTQLRAVSSNSTDWLNDVADGFNFETLFNLGIITTADFIPVPYVISAIPNYTESAISILGVYIMVKEIRDAVQRIAEFTADLPVYYVFSTYVKIILYIIYLILLIIALIKMIQNIINLIIQPIKYHKGMFLNDLLKKGAQHLGKTFQSTIFDNAPYNTAFILPEKFYNPTNSGIKQILGFTKPDISQEGYYKGSYGDLLRAVKTMVCGKLIVTDTTISIEREDFNPSTPAYHMDPRGIYQPFRNYNSEDCKATTLVSFLTDQNDRNTIQEYTGTSYQVTLQPQRVLNPNNVLMKGLEEWRIPFALAKRKENFTVPEQILIDFLNGFEKLLGGLVKVVNGIISVLNGIINIVKSILKKLKAIGINVNINLPTIPKVKVPNFSGVIENRIGMLKLENDIINVPKIMLLQQSSTPKQTKIQANNASLMSARELYSRFHFVRSFLPSSARPNGNQYEIFQYDTNQIPFTFNDFLLVKNNNRIFTETGETAIVKSLKWNPYTETASMEIWINRLYTNNLREILIEPSGQ